MPCAYRARAHTRATPLVPRPKKVLTDDEKEARKLEHEAKKLIKEKKKQWEESLPKPWVEPRGAPFRHPKGTHIMFRTDAQRSFSLTETELLTLPHESIPCSRKTYYALPDVRALQKRRYEAGALAEAGIKGYSVHVLKSVCDTGNRKKANFSVLYSGEVGYYNRMWGPGGRMTQLTAMMEASSSGGGKSCLFSAF